MNVVHVRFVFRKVEGHCFLAQPSWTTPWIVETHSRTGKPSVTDGYAAILGTVMEGFFRDVGGRDENLASIKRIHVEVG